MPRCCLVHVGARCIKTKYHSSGPHVTVSPQRQSPALASILPFNHLTLSTSKQWAPYWELQKMSLIAGRRFRTSQCSICFNCELDESSHKGMRGEVLPPDRAKGSVYDVPGRGLFALFLLKLQKLDFGFAHCMARAYPVSLWCWPRLRNLGHLPSCGRLHGRFHQCCPDQLVPP